MQLVSLIMQNRSVEALELGCATLNALDCPVPTGEDLAQQIADSCDELAAWAAQTSTQTTDHGPDVDPRIEAVSVILTTLIQSAFFSGSPLTPWLVVTAARIWSRSGPSIALLSPLGHAAFITVALRDDFRTGYDVVRKVLTAAETINREPDSSFVQFIYALTCGPWFEPLQDSLHLAREAHERLARAGDLYSAGCTYFVSVPLMLECAETLGAYQGEIERGLDFAAATGNDQIEGFLAIHRSLVAALTDQAQAPAPSVAAEPLALDPVMNGPADGARHLGHAELAMLLNDPVGLAQHAPAAVAHIPFYQATPPVITAHLAQALNLVIHAQQASEKGDLLAQFDVECDWIARRAEDAPGNFHHLILWLDAERAWAGDQFESAVRGFDAAQRESDARQRPWHRALIAERRGRFLLHHAIEHAARAALREAHRRYHQWGAVRKTADLRHEFPFLTAVAETLSPTPSPSSTGTRDQGSVSSQNIDLMAVLRASQAISSETRLDRLADQVGQVLCELTGATSARLLLHDQDAGWLLLHPDGQMQPIASAITAGLLPATVIRYVERTREPLLVDDATRDDRFSQDPYLHDLQQCALLTLPVLSGGHPSAMLLLENRDTRGAFGTNRLDTVLLLAGQLAVALGNAMLYTALERKVADRTQALEAANAQLELLAVTDPLTGLPNRRRLSDTMTRQWQGQSPDSLPVSIAMIDIDHFKKYNDHYGHPAGDECLRRVAAAISGSVRESDVVIRYGGEEFAILLADADEQIAARVTERVRAAVAELALAHEASDAKRVTVSIGVATSMPATIAPEELLSTADTYLYEAKRTGRNRVIAGPG
jgi:diguanylate cyclase (GGDEF)-like protein